jgi:hypothetical protein
MQKSSFSVWLFIKAKLVSYPTQIQLREEKKPFLAQQKEHYRHKEISVFVQFSRWLVIAIFSSV